VAVDVLQVVGQKAERAAQIRSLADEDTTGFEWLIEPLVQIERERIGERQTLEQMAALVAKNGSGAVRAIDVEPEMLRIAEPAQLGQGIDGAGVGGAGAGNYAEGPFAGGAILRDGSGQSWERQAEFLIAGKAADLIGQAVNWSLTASSRRQSLS